MYEHVTFEVEGLVPLMQHNVQLANPMSSVVQAMKPLTSKRQKTDEDFFAIAQLEFKGGLYLDEDGHVIVPGEAIEATLVNGAKKFRKGTQAKLGILVDGNFKLDYPGAPHTAEQLWADEALRGQHMDQRMVTINRVKVLRTRPIFPSWKLKFTVSYLPDVFNPNEVVEITEAAGLRVGFLEHRPKYGRFKIVAHNAPKRTDAAKPKAAKKSKAS